MVFGFSPGLARPLGSEPIRYIESAIAHAAVNACMKSAHDRPPPEIKAFMSIDEVREMVSFGNAKIALHGCVHLNLEPIPGRISRLEAFRRDAEDGAELLKGYGFASDTFVYPYAFREDGYEYVVNRLGFTKTYACPGSYRI